MKKLSIVAIVFAAIALASCGGKKVEQDNTATEEKSFDQQQIEEKIKVEVDSLAALLGELKQTPFIQEGSSFALTADEKKVKPEYLLSASFADEAATLAEKYRALGALSVDRKVAALYDMPTEEFDKAITKLSADINDPSFKAIENANNIFETSTALYNSMNENGRINNFWQLASAALVEQLFVINQNSDKFLTAFDDKAASDVTYRIVLLLDAVKKLTEYDPDIKPVADALSSLDVLNATTVDELKKQLAEGKDKIEAARKALLK